MCPVQNYLYFERSFRKWEYFFLNALIFWDQKIILNLQNLKTCFLKRGGVHMCKYKYIYYVARVFSLWDKHMM